MTPLWADTLIELVKNEVGLVITGHFCVDKMQRADAGQPVLDETTDESLLRRACDGVHRYGGKLFFQLSHSGIKGVESVNGAPPKHPEDFTREELDRLVEQFAFAAKKCKESGADGVQVSGIDFNRRAGQKTPFYLDALKAAREGISIPLFPVGGVFSRGTAEEILAQGFPLVSMSRALICEPDFAAKLKSGAQDGSKCLACNGCYTIYRKRFVRCVQHQDEIEQFKTIPW